MYGKDILHRFALPMGFLALCAGLSVAAPYFLTPQNILNTLVASSTLGVLAVGAALVIGARGIDLSVGAVMAFSAGLSGLCLNLPGTSGPMMIGVCLAAGLLVGLINGTLAAYTVLPPFIITLAMMSMVRGLAYIVTDGRPMYGLPSEVLLLGQGTLFGLPVPILIFVIVAVGGHIILTRTPFGIHLCAYGDNPTAAEVNGINVYRLKLVLYALSGLMGAVAGLIFMGRLNTIDPGAGMMVELTAVTAVMMGGASLSGGRTSVIGAVLGALVIAFLQNGLNLLAIPSFYQYIAVGVMLLAAVLLQSRSRP